MTPLENLIRVLPIVDVRSKYKSATKHWNTRDVAKIRGLVIHQSAGGDSVDGLAKYHMGPNHMTAGLPDDHPFKHGLPGISYTFFVNKLGNIFLVNDLESATWSQGDASKSGDENAIFVSACFGGSFRALGWPDGHEDPSPVQLFAFETIWDRVRSIWNLTNLDLYGHFLFGKPTCPGDVLRGRIEAVRKTNEADVVKFNQARAQQEVLKRRGYYPGLVDGIFGPQSIDALRHFQIARSLPVTGRWSYLETAEVVRLGG